MSAPGFWDDSDHAAKVSGQHAATSKRVAGFADLDRRVEQNRYVRPRVPVNPVRNPINGLHRNTAATALVSPARVGKAIANDPGTCLKRRHDDVVNVE